MRKGCHCGVKEHLRLFRAKKIGVLGATLIGLHILFHIIECLIFPTMVVMLSENITRGQVATGEGAISVESSMPEASLTSAKLIEFQHSLWGTKSSILSEL